MTGCTPSPFLLVPDVEPLTRSSRRWYSSYLHGRRARSPPGRAFAGAEAHARRNFGPWNAAAPVRGGNGGVPAVWGGSYPPKSPPTAGRTRREYSSGAHGRPASGCGVKAVLGLPHTGRHGCRPVRPPATAASRGGATRPYEGRGRKKSRAAGAVRYCGPALPPPTADRARHGPTYSAGLAGPG